MTLPGWFWVFPGIILAIIVSIPLVGIWLRRKDHQGDA